MSIPIIYLTTVSHCCIKDQKQKYVGIIWVYCLVVTFSLFSVSVSNYHVLQAVLEAHNAVISTMKPGVNWVDMHL